MSDEIINSIWARRLAWSQAADRLGRRISRARSATLILGCVGAIFETMAATILRDIPDMRTAFAAAGSVFLALSTFVAARAVTGDALRAWTATRSVSEALKAEILLCRARGGRYAEGDRFAQLNRAADMIEDAASEFTAQLAPVRLKEAAGPGELGQQDYIEVRLTGHANNYFRAVAVRYARRVRILRIVTIACGATATIFGALAAYMSAAPIPNLDLAAWVAVLTTIGGAVAAEISARRYDFLILTFLTTARRLDSLANEWRSGASARDAAAWSAFVQRCEDLIASANQSWVDKVVQPESG